MGEFALISDILEALGDRAAVSPQAMKTVVVPPGDDATVVTPTPGWQHVASIDSFLANVHFPEKAPPELIGYRVLMASLSDLAAMAATPRYALVALSMEAALLKQDESWHCRLALGMAEAAREADMYICGGNLSQGPLAITVSVHGEVAEGCALLRSTGRAGHGLYVSGTLGGASACLRLGQTNIESLDNLTPLQACYFRPKARFDLLDEVGKASACIDISDGLLQDLGHLCDASSCGAKLQGGAIPLAPGATLEDALRGGDEYQLLLASEVPLLGCQRIGQLTEEVGIWLDEQQISADGYNHFHA